MYAIREGVKSINCRFVKTIRREVAEDGTRLHAEAGTSGAFTYMSLICDSGNFHFDSITDDEGKVTGVGIVSCGESGLEAAVKALQFAVDVLNDQKYRIEN